MKPILYILVLLLVSKSWGQSFPSPDKIGIFEKADEKSRLKNEFLKEVQISKDNYYVKTVANDYILLFEQLHAARGKASYPKSKQHVRCSIGAEFNSMGFLEESEFRNTYFFKRNNGYWAMLTTWNVAPAGAWVSFPKYLVNDTVNAMGVVTVLGVPVTDKLRRAVWKSIWHKDGILFELYIQTTLHPPLVSEFDYSDVAKTIKLIAC